MIRAYDRNYLPSAQRILGRVFDLAINTYGMSPEEISWKFIGSGYSKLFAMGHPTYVAGMSGRDFLKLILNVENTEATEVVETDVTPSREYWAGWILAYYQWYGSRSFESILSNIPFEDIIRMYSPFHEMDPSQFVNAMETRFRNATRESSLKKRRTFCGLSQSELAKRSGVKLRMIQLYEQGRNNIGRAQYTTLARLATVLRCPVDALVDDPLYAGEMDVEDFE